MLEEMQTPVVLGVEIKKNYELRDTENRWVVARG